MSKTWAVVLAIIGTVVVIVLIRVWANKNKIKRFEVGASPNPANIQPDYVMGDFNLGSIPG